MGTVEHLMVELSNRDGGSVEKRWWNSGTSYGGTVEHLMVEQWNIWWWNSRTSDGATVKHLTVEQ